MKKILFLFCAVMMMVACTSLNEPNNESNASIETDSGHEQASIVCMMHIIGYSELIYTYALYDDGYVELFAAYEKTRSSPYTEEQAKKIMEFYLSQGINIVNLF